MVAVWRELIWSRREPFLRFEQELEGLSGNSRQICADGGDAVDRQGVLVIGVNDDADIPADLQVEFLESFTGKQGFVSQSDQKSIRRIRFCQPLGDDTADVLAIGSTGQYAIV